MAKNLEIPMLRLVLVRPPGLARAYDRWPWLRDCCTGSWSRCSPGLRCRPYPRHEGLRYSEILILGVIWAFVGAVYERIGHRACQHRVPAPGVRALRQDRRLWLCDLST